KRNVKKENIILNVGRFRVISKEPLNDYKKQAVMIKVFSQMVRSGFKNWKFILAVSIRKSDEGEFKKLQSLAENLPIEFLINKENDELWDIYSKAKIYWH